MSTVIPPELGGRILWADAPERNERIYAHLGCDESPRHWIVPLDRYPPPDGTTMECPLCCRVVKLVAGQVTFPEVRQVEIPERGAAAPPARRPFKVVRG